MTASRPERPEGAKDEVRRPKGPPARSRGPEGPYTSCIIYYISGRERVKEKKEEDLSLHSRRSHSLCRDCTALHCCCTEEEGEQRRRREAAAASIHCTLPGPFLGRAFTAPGAGDPGPPWTSRGSQPCETFFCGHSEEPRWRQAQSQMHI